MGANPDSTLSSEIIQRSTNRMVGSRLFSHLPFSIRLSRTAGVTREDKCRPHVNPAATA